MSKLYFFRKDGKIRKPKPDEIKNDAKSYVDKRSRLLSAEEKAQKMWIRRIRELARVKGRIT